MPQTASSLEALFTKDQRLRIFNDTVPAGILVVSVTDGRVIFANRFFTEVLGINAAAIMSSNWRDIFVEPEDREKLLQRFTETGEVRNFELRLHGDAGRIVWGLASLSEIPIDDEDLLLFAFVDISALKQAEAEIRALADHDSLTGLLSLRRFHHELQAATSRSKRDSSHFAVMFIDLDRFKAVNDSLGHEAGDAVLRETAQRLKECVRATDTIARIGGDEFVVLAEQITPELASLIAERIVERISQPFILPEGSASIGASIGIALHPAHGEEPSRLIKAADHAMYSVKRTSKGAVAFAA